MPRTYTAPLYEFEVPWWVFDAAIVLLLALLAAAHAAATAFGWPLLSILALLGFLTIAYGSFIEPRLLKVRRYRIGEGARGVNVAFLSDLHVGPYKGLGWMERLVRETMALSPDVILIGGDLLYKDAADLPKLEPLKRLEAPLGVYAILGNHDERHAAAETKAWFERAGIPLLLNRSVRLAKGAGHIAIVGADDDWYGETDLASAFRDVLPEDLAVVMLHNPDLAPPAAELAKGRPGPTVFLSGHTHGGQIRLPFLGSVWKIPHHLGREYDRGRFDFQGIPLIIGAGTGESGPRARLFCPPEIVLVELRY